jgi:HAD superfamily hydrolase (TIGR01509 family)
MTDWQALDTVLLDMDGTLLDLAFDNYFWREAVPRCIARRGRLAFDATRSRLFEHYALKQGSLDWYCLDYWTRTLDLDIRALKAASSQRIRFHSGAPDFLRRLAASGRRVVLVTNAHHDALAMKRDVTGLGSFFDAMVSAHTLGYPKEDARFWPLLAAHLGLEPARTALVDDSLPVLAAARRFGIPALIAVPRPDSRAAVRAAPGYFAVEHLGELLPAPGDPVLSAG